MFQINRKAVKKYVQTLFLLISPVRWDRGHICRIYLVIQSCFLEEVQVWPWFNKCHCLCSCFCYYRLHLLLDLSRAQKISRDFPHSKKLIKQGGATSLSCFLVSGRNNSLKLPYNQLLLCKLSEWLHEKGPETSPCTYSSLNLDQYKHQKSCLLFSSSTSHHQPPWLDD